jgi:2-polyprenyl-6-hydroxyphenyl methylase/3-demethylubiquinone-9 3-methyltransferase
MTATTATLDAAEVERFARLAAEWWDANGKFRTLHLIGPARLTFLRDALLRHFGRAPGQVSEQAHVGAKPLAGLTILDIGCGGGLVCEPLARLGATVMGIDPAADNVEAASRHAEAQGLAISYRTARVENLVAEGRTFDAVVCLEVIEHVPDPGAFLATCAGLVAPGGLMLLSTINRTLKAYLLAIVGAEYVLRWVPAGTHQWERFVTPDELGRHLRAAGLEAPTLRGMIYNPMADTWSLSTDTDVNYLAAAAKPGSPLPAALGTDVVNAPSRMAQGRRGEEARVPSRRSGLP